MEVKVLSVKDFDILPLNRKKVTKWPVACYRSVAGWLGTFGVESILTSNEAINFGDLPYKQATAPKPILSIKIHRGPYVRINSVKKKNPSHAFPHTWFYHHIRQFQAQKLGSCVKQPQLCLFARVSEVELSASLTASCNIHCKVPMVSETLQLFIHRHECLK